ncbi:hypothetical protein Echvi_3020 [Echinicola vietnamensis DSM 17526]|uniref:Uncharacterized protein n=1 Tax=Echinicola vietnamensis (strain DSM 17526 / LMG 23754 / KMM 6221) TaxID=926556 RepID=L0G1R9_ECHVK|nr:hypothetical protein Echvi_3020 [Echinicola vietnamensis DSM 17526]
MPIFMIIDVRFFMDSLCKWLGFLLLIYIFPQHLFYQKTFTLYIDYIYKSKIKR